MTIMHFADCHFVDLAIRHWAIFISH